MTAHRHSSWIDRWAGLVPPRSHILDFACGNGRNGRFFLERGNRVTFLDIDLSRVRDLAETQNATLLERDMEGQADWVPDDRFDAVVVVNYLHRANMTRIVDLIRPGGYLFYETFMTGNERYGRPRNPDFLLKPGELREICEGRMTLVAYEEGYDETPNPAMKQKLVARTFA